MLYSYVCSGKCGHEFDEMKSYADRNEVFCCGVRSHKLICMEPNVFNETQHYNFTALPGRFGKQGIEVRGRSHYKQLIKEHGLADCSLKEAMSVKPKADNGYKRKQVIKKAASRMKSEGILKHVPSFMKDVVKMNIKI